MRRLSVQQALWIGYENMAKAQNTLRDHGVAHDRADAEGDINAILDQVHAPLS